MAWIAASIAAAASVGGALLGGDKAKQAAAKRARAAREAQALQQGNYLTSLALNEPWRATGQGALNQLARVYGLPYQDYTPAQTLAQQYAGSGEATTFGAKAVSSMLKRGMSIEDIAKLGVLSTSGKAVKKLAKRGVSAEQIRMLQGGPSQFVQPAAVNNLASGGGQAGPDMSVFTASPDYTFRRGEGIRDIEQGAAARGGALSGNALRAVTGYSSNLAAGEFGNWFNRMAQLAGYGTGATSADTAAGQNYATGAGNAIMAGGEARASGLANQANIWGNAGSSIADAWGNYFGNRLPQFNERQYADWSENFLDRNFRRQPNAFVLGG